MTVFTDAADIRALVAELDEPSDLEHPDVALGHESGWSLSAFPAGLVVWEDVEGDGGMRYRTSVTRDELVELFSALARGDRSTINRGNWVPGYGPGPTESPTPRPR